MNYYFPSILLLVLLILIWLFLRVQKSILQPTTRPRTLLLVKFPKEEKEEKNLKEEIRISEQLFNLLSEFKREAIFEVAVHHVGEEIHFYIAADGKAVNFISYQIQKLWPAVQLSTVDDYDVFNPQGFNEGAYLKLAHEPSLPLRTYEQAEIDTFAPILGVLARLEEVGEGAAIQLIFRPASKAIRRKITHPSPLKERGRGKVAKPLFEVNLRLVASAPSQFRVREIFENLMATFSQFSSLRENELRIVKPKNIKKFHFRFCFREFDEEEAMILNSEELVSLFHFPTSSMLIPRIKWLKSKEVRPPRDLSNRGVIVGENIFQGQVKPIYLDYPDRAHHLEIIGQAGTGKSTLIINLAVQDIKQGKGVVVLDPEGDIVQGIAGMIPKERIADVIYLDPTDIWRPFGLNLLEFDFHRTEEKTFIIDEVQAIFNKLFPSETMGPLFAKYLKNSLRLLLTNIEPATLLDVPRIFTNASFRQKKLRQATDPALIEFWENEVSLHEITPFITSKFNNLIANDYLRPIVGQTQSAFNFRRALDEGKIILVNLAKSRLGDFNANLLGLIFVEKISLAAFSRIDEPQEKRRPCYLFLDQFYNYFTDSLATYLTRVSKYGLYLNVSHRSTDELSDALLNLINNFGSIIAFRVGLDDAHLLIDKFEPTFSVNDLINLDNFNAYSRILIRGVLSPPFNIRTLLPQATDLALVKEVKELSRTVYNQNRQKVEMEIYERLSSR